MIILSYRTVDVDDSIFVDLAVFTRLCLIEWIMDGTLIVCLFDHLINRTVIQSVCHQNNCFIDQPANQTIDHTRQYSNQTSVVQATIDPNQFSRYTLVQTSASFERQSIAHHCQLVSFYYIQQQIDQVSLKHIKQADITKSINFVSRYPSADR